MLVACDFSDTDVDNLVIGSVWALSNDDFLAFENEVIKLRLQHNCWGSLQWKKSKSEKVNQMYLELVGSFLMANICFSCIAINKDIFRRYGAHVGKDRKRAIPKFLYWLISRTARRYVSSDGPKKEMTILLDREGRKREEILFIKSEIQSYAIWKVMNARVAHIQECDMHMASTLQLCDILTGAVSHRMNKTTTNQSNEALCQLLENKLGTSLALPTPPAHKFNIWRWWPAGFY